MILHFHPTTWFQSSEGLSVKRRPVGNTSTQCPAMDEVKLFKIPKQPFTFGVVNIELQVGGDPSRLDRTQVRCNDCGHGEEIGNFDGPNACPRADVQDSTRLFWQRCCV